MSYLIRLISRGTQRHSIDMSVRILLIFVNKCRHESTDEDELLEESMKIESACSNL